MTIPARIVVKTMEFVSLISNRSQDAYALASGQVIDAVAHQPVSIFVVIAPPIAL